MTLAEFVAKLQEYPQHMKITLEGSDYGIKIYGSLSEVDHLIELVDGYDQHEEPLRWADTKTFKQRGQA
jgi:hypothetical protein